MIYGILHFLPRSVYYFSSYLLRKVTFLKRPAEGKIYFPPRYEKNVFLSTKSDFSMSIVNLLCDFMHFLITAKWCICIIFLRSQAQIWQFLLRGGRKIITLHLEVKKSSIYRSSVNKESLKLQVDWPRLRLDHWCTGIIPINMSIRYLLGPAI